MNAIAIIDHNSSFNSAKLSGFVSFHQCDAKTQTIVHIKLSGLPPNSTHGIHVHEEGDLSKGCESLCAHYNPYNTKHGSSVLYGTDRHVGDMCNNVVSDSKGNVDYTYIDDLIDLFEPNSIIGRSIVIHADPDDLGRYRNQTTQKGIDSGKTGNAGKRIACAVIGRSKTDFHKQ